MTVFTGFYPTLPARQRALLRWYRSHGRHALPWRHRITPYSVLVSEIMLQQTQVDRVIPYFTAWMKRWPTVEHLARAKRSDVIRAWAGLGYNRRAVYLHRAAQEIVRDPTLQNLFAFSHEIAKGSAGGYDLSPSTLDGSPLRVRARGSERGRREAHGEIKRGWSSRTNEVHTGNLRSRYPLPHFALWASRGGQLPLHPSAVLGTFGRGRVRRAGSAPRSDDTAQLAKRLRRLPGIGSYTAHAILAFAWNLPAPCVDVNVRRVLAYAIYKRPAIMKMPLAEVERLAARVIPSGQGRAWNSALMDYGALMFQAHHVPRQHRPRPPQPKFANSPRFWRGRIVAALRGDVSQSGKNTKKQKYTFLDGRPKMCHPIHQFTLVQLRRALAAYGTPPPLAPLLAALVRDGVITKRGLRYALA